MVATALLVGATVARDAARTQASAPTDGSTDAGFARDMSRHHAQAVEMSMMVLNRSQDPTVRQLATDILLTQQQQIGQMYGWLSLWGLDKSTMRPSMAWMTVAAGEEAGEEALGSSGMSTMAGHDMSATPSTGAMPGMATKEQLEALAAADGERADRIYLQLMILHHRGGVQMARAAQSSVGQTVTRDLADRIVTSQVAELAVLNRMLGERGGAVPL